MSNPAPKNKSIDERIEELNQQIDWFYGDDFALSEAVDKYKQATQLAKSIEQDLESLKNEIEVLSQDFSAE